MEFRSRASKEQFAASLEVMKSHGDITRPQQGPQGRIKADRLWLELEGILNSTGGGVTKSIDKWKKALPSQGNSLPPPTRNTVQAVHTVCPSQISDLDEIMLDFIPSYSIQATSSASTAALSLPPPSGELPCPIPPAPSPPPGTAFAPIPSAMSTASTSRGPLLRRRHQASPSPTASASPTASTTRRHGLFRTRTRRVQTPFERSTSEFVAIENRRLQLEADRERNLHERELERSR